MSLLNNTALDQTPKLSHTRTIVLTAMFTALVYVFTMININPFGIPGGLIHIGNIPFFIAAILFGRKVGAISGGVGMALFDVLSPYAIWAPFTLIIGLVSGYLMGMVTERKKNYFTYILAILIATVFKIGGYYVAEAVIYGNWITPVHSIFANVLQIAFAAPVVLILLLPLHFASKKTISKS